MNPRRVLHSAAVQSSLGWSVLLVGCGVETGQDQLTVPLFVAGTSSDPVQGPGDIELTPNRASLAFGPLYLCAGSQAGDFCETARLEWLDSTVIDVLDDRAVRAGSLQGVGGSVASWMYDLGITSTLTRSRPFELAAVRDLDGASIVLEGTARRDEHTLPFSVRVRVDPGAAGQRGAVLVQQSGSSSFRHNVTVDEPGLLVRFDATAWLRALDLQRYFDSTGCAEGATVACDGDVAEHCMAGSTSERIECDEGALCVASVGCTDVLRLDSSAEQSAVRNAVVAGAPPDFRWGHSP